MSKDSEIKNEPELKKKNKLSKILIILIVIVVILIAIELITNKISEGLSAVKHAIFRTIGVELKEGNYEGNINNYGYITEDDKYVYFMSPNDDGRYIGITKAKKSDLTGKQTRLIEGEWELASINSYGNYIYFVTLVQNDVDENDETADKVDNKIHRVKKDGTNHQIINDNDFNDYAYKVSVVGGKIYYIGKDECIWYMNLDGTKKTRLNENATGFEIVNNDYIIYNMYKEGSTEENQETVTYIMDRNGKNARPINGERFYTPVIYKDYIYYITEERYLHRIKINGTGDEMLSDEKVYNLNVSKDGVFYVNYYYVDGKAAGLAVFRMDLDGKNVKELHRLEEETNSVCVTKDWIFYLDSNETEGRMELLSFDGKQNIVLFKLYYSNYYYLPDLIEDSKNDNPDGSQETDGNITNEETDTNNS